MARARRSGSKHRFALPWLLATAPAVLLQAEEPAVWPQFRGPGAIGVAESDSLPTAWSATENVVWKVAVPGRGWSSPIVWGDRVYVTTAVSAAGDDEAEPKKGLYLGGNRSEAPAADHRWIVRSLHTATGETVWEREVHRGKPPAPRHVKNSYASETPVTDGERVYAYFGDLGLFALDREGEVVWSKKWGAFKTRHDWGPAASPVLHDGRLYLVNDNEESSFLAAVDARTGDEIWRVPRDEKSNWSTPFVWKHAAQTEIVTVGSGAARAYDLDGKLLWQLRGMSTITIPSPFASHGLLFVGSGFVLDPDRPLYAIRPGAKGDITLREGARESESVAWCQPQAAPYNPSPLVYEDQLYVLLDRGFLSAYEARTGKEVYSKTRLGKGADAFTASPWGYRGRVFCASEDGDTFVVRAGPSFELLGVNRLGEMCMGSPAMAGRSLYIRTLRHLWRIEEAAEEK